MSDKLTLNDLSSLANEASAIASINSNNAAIETALDNTLSRDGTSPNEMGATLDMDSNAIINLPEPQTSTEPVRLIDLDLITGVSEDAMTALTLGTVPKGTRAYIKTLDTSSVSVVYCNESGREGLFQWKTGNYSTKVATDTCEGIYIKATAVSASTGAWVRIFNGPVELSWFGPYGDGSTNDSAIIQCCLDTAGDNSSVRFSPNTTYSVWARCTTAEGQEVDFNGATMKMCNQVSTTSTQGISNATTSFTVTDASAFRVGMSVTIAKVGVARSSLADMTSLNSGDVRITAINGNTITISPYFVITGTFGSGSTIVNAFNVLQVSSNCTIKNGTIDGNRTNRSWARWETDALLMTENPSEYSTVTLMTFQNSPGEGIICDGTGHRFENCQFLTLGGNGIHFSASVNPVFINNYMVSGNLDTAVGHGGGAVCWSVGITDADISGNYIEGFMAGIGQHGDTDSDTVIHNNTIRGCYAWGMFFDASTSRITVTNNRLVDNDTNTAVATASTDSYGGIYMGSLSGSDYVISGNYIEDAHTIYCVCVSSGRRVVITDNTLVGDVFLVGGYKAVMANNAIKGILKLGNLDGAVIKGNNIDLEGITNKNCVAFYSGSIKNTIFEGNYLAGGNWGLTIDSSLSAVAGLTIKNNHLYDQVSRGINCNFTSPTGLSISSNTLHTGANTSTNLIGINVDCTIYDISGNTLHSATASNGSKVAIESNAASAPKGVIAFNRVFGTWATSVYVVANSGAFVQSNVLDTGVTDSTGNNVSGTVTI